MTEPDPGDRARLPSQSLGVLAAPLGPLTVLYDLVTETVHVLNESAGLLWAACDGVSDRLDLAQDLAGVTFADLDDVRSGLDAGLAEMSGAGLVGRTEAAPQPPAVEITEVVGASATAVFAVLDEGVVLRGDDLRLLGEVDTLLASMAADRLATVALGVAETDGGSVRVAGHGPERTYASVEAFLDTLPTALNQIAATSSSCIALHAGCVRSPSGEVLLLPAVSGSGKTTLTAALVQAGWDYGTDEAVGVREGGLEAVTYPKPLVLDSSSRLVLGLGPSRFPNAAPAELRADVEVLVDSAGPVGRVVLPRYEEGATAVLSDPLDPQAAVTAVLEHALNLRRVGQPGLAALCQLAERVPVQRLVHGGVDQAVDLLSPRP